VEKDEAGKVGAAKKNTRVLLPFRISLLSELLSGISSFLLFFRSAYRSNSVSGFNRIEDDDLFNQLKAETELDR
jgi:hypothetical protein